MGLGGSWAGAYCNAPMGTHIECVRECENRFFAPLIHAFFTSPFCYIISAFYFKSLQQPHKHSEHSFKNSLIGEYLIRIPF